MFARKVAVRLKPDSLSDFTDLMLGEILPWLRKQPGFLDLIILSDSDNREVATISFWDHQGNAEAYNSSGYPRVVKVLEELLDGKPYVKRFDVVSSTLHKVVVPPPRHLEPLVGETDMTQADPRSYETRA
jgi:heme-degrading monooxygenase HmoA